MEKTRTEQNLPAELWLEIISRLPVKSLLRYRCVSKSWRSLIDDPNFCRSHLNNFKNNKLETHLFGANYIGARGRVCVVYCSETFVSSMVLDPLKSSSGCTKNLLNNYNWSIVCSLDGLVLLRFSSRVMPAGLDGLELILWNPSIRRARVLHSCSPFGESEKYYDLGFGFDPIIGDYKHVRFVKHGESNLRSIELYTVGSGIWRTIQYQDAGGSKWRWKFCDWYRWQCLCCREILYFSPSRIHSGAQELVSFDLSSEVFDSTSLPIDHDGNLIKYGGLMLLDGGCSLGLVHVLGTSGSIWVLESSGADIDSMYWTKRYTFPSRIYPSSPIRYHLYIKKNGEFLVHENKQVTSYDLGTHEEKTLMIDHDLRMVGFKAHAYIEGLLLLHG